MRRRSRRLHPARGGLCGRRWRAAPRRRRAPSRPDPLYRTSAGAVAPVGRRLHPAAGRSAARPDHCPRQLHAGRLPGWNPLSAAGAPLWAEQAGPFFPLKLPFYLAPSQSDLRALPLPAPDRGRARRLGRWRARAAWRRSARSPPALPSSSRARWSNRCRSAPLAVLPAALGRARAPRRSPVPAAPRRGRPPPWRSACVPPAAGIRRRSRSSSPLSGRRLAGHMSRAVRDPRAALAHRRLGGAWRCCSACSSRRRRLLPLGRAGRARQLLQSGARLGEFNLADQLAHSRATLPLALLAPHVLQRMYLDAGLGPLFEGFASLGVVGLVLAVAGVLGGGLSPPLAVPRRARRRPRACTARAGLDVRAAGLRAISAYYAWPLVVLPLTQAIGTGWPGLAARPVFEPRPLAVAVALACGVSCARRRAGASDRRRRRCVLFGAALGSPARDGAPVRSRSAPRLSRSRERGTVGAARRAGGRSQRPPRSPSSCWCSGVPVCGAPVSAVPDRAAVARRRVVAGQSRRRRRRA